MMTDPDYSLAEKIPAHERGPANAYDTGLPPTRPLDDGAPWSMPVVGRR